VVTTTVDESVVEKSERTVHWYPCLPRPHRKPLHSPQNVGWRKNLQCEDALGRGSCTDVQSGVSDYWVHCIIGGATIANGPHACKQAPL
jgi:hypothetical protein